MNKIEKKMMIAKKVSFSEAENLDIEYYARIDWKESAVNVEKMRRMIWSKEYSIDQDRVITITGLKDDRDDFK